MSKKPKLGGTVRISYKNYEVTTAPYKHDGRWLLTVSDPDNGNLFVAESAPGARAGCGPWRITYQLVS